jgi:uncharacterized protein YndB with AHSA1/START domain
MAFVAQQTYYLDTPPSQVYRALIDPARLVRWFLTAAELEPRKGGPFVFEWDGGYRMESRVIAVEPGRRLVLRWLDAQPDGTFVRTRVDLRVRRKGMGTLLELRHSGFTRPRHYAECSRRWAYYLTNLKSVLDHGTDLRSSFDE